MPQPDIFISYNHEDAAVAKRYADAFSREGLEVWWDQTIRSGETYDEVTEAALRGAKAVVVLWSPRSVASHWVRAEATVAHRAKTLLPATIEPCNRPVMFELTQTADLSHWKGDAGDSEWMAFLADVRRKVGAEIDQAPATGQAPERQPSHARTPSIAVLPFINRSGVSDDEVFADCIVADLTSALSLSRRMKVVAARATAIYRNSAHDLREIGRQLAVHYVLEGNVRRAGDNFRITAQLVEAEHGNILWTQKFDRPLAERSLLQDDLAIEMAAHLGVQVERAEMEHVLKESGNVSARDAIVRSDALSMGRPTPARAEAAVMEARRAVSLAPGYAPAYAALAGALSAYLCHVCGFNDPEVEREIIDNVEKARALDPRNPLVLCRIAAALQSVGQDEDALLIAERAVAINPNLEIVRAAFADILLRQWRGEEAIAQCDAAERLAPDGMWAGGLMHFRSVAHFQAGRFEQALTFIEKSRRVADLYSWQVLKVLCLTGLERGREAAEAMRELRRSWPDMTVSFAETYVRKEHMFARDARSADKNAAIVRRLWNEAESPR